MERNVVFIRPPIPSFANSRSSANYANRTSRGQSRKYRAFHNQLYLISEMESYNDDDASNGLSSISQMVVEETTELDSHSSKSVNHTLLDEANHQFYVNICGINQSDAGDYNLEGLNEPQLHSVNEMNYVNDPILDYNQDNLTVNTLDSRLHNLPDHQVYTEPPVYQANTPSLSPVFIKLTKDEQYSPWISHYAKVGKYGTPSASWKQIGSLIDVPGGNIQQHNTSAMKGTRDPVPASLDEEEMNIIFDYIRNFLNTNIKNAMKFSKTGADNEPIDQDKLSNRDIWFHLCTDMENLSAKAQEILTRIKVDEEKHKKR